MARLTAAKKSNLNTIENIVLITPQGEILHRYPINLPVEDEYIIPTDEFRIPKEPFYIGLEGIDTSIVLSIICLWCKLEKITSLINKSRRKFLSSSSNWANIPCINRCRCHLFIFKNWSLPWWISFCWIYHHQLWTSNNHHYSSGWWHGLLDLS